MLFRSICFTEQTESLKSPGIQELLKKELEKPIKKWGEKSLKEQNIINFS